MRCSKTEIAFELSHRIIDGRCPFLWAVAPEHTARAVTRPSSGGTVGALVAPEVGGAGALTAGGLVACCGAGPPRRRSSGGPATDTTGKGRVRHAVRGAVGGRGAPSPGGLRPMPDANTPNAAQAGRLEKSRSPRQYGHVWGVGGGGRLDERRTKQDTPRVQAAACPQRQRMQEGGRRAPAQKKEPHANRWRGTFVEGDGEHST